MVGAADNDPGNRNSKELSKVHPPELIVIPLSERLIARLTLDGLSYSNVGCPAGFGDLGVMGPSKHDSVDNSNSFHQQPVKIRSDHFCYVFQPHQNPPDSVPDLANLQ